MRMKMVVSGVLAFLALSTGIGVTAGTAHSAAQPHIVIPTDVTISQVAVRGPAGPADEFIELHNQTMTSKDVSGWIVQACNSRSQIMNLITLPAGTVLQPQAQQGEFLLLANVLGYSRDTTPDLVFTTDIPLSGGIKLVDTTNVTHDSVGFSGNNACTSGSPATVQRLNEDQALLRVATTGFNSVDFRLYGSPTFQRNQFSG